MAADREMTFELEGSPDDMGRVRLSALQAFISNVQRSLMAVQTDLVGAPTRDTVLRVSALSFASPVKLTVEAVVSGPEAVDRGPQLAAAYKRALRDVSAGRRPPGLQPRTVKLLGGVAAPYTKQAAAIRLVEDDEKTSIPADLPSRIEILLGRVFRTHGSYRGRLEAVNLHTNPRVLYLYPLVGPTRVRCTYRPKTIKNIAPYLEQRVEVRGVLKFRGDEDFPFEIEVGSAPCLLPSQEDLPTADEVIGSMPDLTGDQTIEEYLHALREEDG